MDPSWRSPAPCKVGENVSDIVTPALVIDMDALDFNLKKLMDILAQYPSVDARPHTKAHKCPSLALKQMEHGAAGVCCQTLVEAEAMVYGTGIPDVFLSNQVVGDIKIKRLVALAKHCRLSIAVENEQNLRDISAAAVEAKVIVSGVIEVDVGGKRCGLTPGVAVAEMAELISTLPNITFKGLHCYNGINQHVRTPEGRQKNVDTAVELIKESLQALSSKGISCKYITGGGTGSFMCEAASGVYTEVQPGSYALMDVDYCDNVGSDGQLIHDFKKSLFVLATVQSLKDGVHAVTDAGIKASSFDSGLPKIHEHPEMTYINGGDNHGILAPPGNLKVGDQVWLIPGHCDPTCNLYDWMVGIRNGKVEHVWSVLARGP